MKKIKEIAKLEKAFKRKHQDESSDSDISKHFEDDDMADIDTSMFCLLGSVRQRHT